VKFLSDSGRPLTPPGRIGKSMPHIGTMRKIRTASCSASYPVEVVLESIDPRAQRSSNYQSDGPPRRSRSDLPDSRSPTKGRTSMHPSSEFGATSTTRGVPQSKSPLARVVAVLVLAISLMGGTTAIAAPAQAAGQECIYVVTQTNRPFRPLAGGIIEYRCYMNSSQGTVAAIAALQRAYNACYTLFGAPGIDEDGIYGDDTKAAVRTIQSTHNLFTDGLYGPATALQLKVKDDNGRCRQL
jgi:peptidoglycan hydrolase-like protein with peptidoglycan-binding domain